MLYGSGVGMLFDYFIEHVSLLNFWQQPRSSKHVT